MDSKKQINVGVSSSLIDLKAELIRKQQQLKAGGSSTSGRNRGALKTQKKSEALRLTSKDYQKNKGVDKRNQKDVERKIEEEKNLEKSKSALEAKARLYDKMQSAALVLGDEDDEEEDGGSDAVKQLYSNSLVNFQQKAVEEIQERRRNKQVESEKKFEEAYPIVEEEWAEFTDGLGRTRKCLKSELPSFLEREEERLAMPENPGIVLSATADDRLREKKREKWELEAELLAAKDKVHYQDILFDEVRTHGVGFYAFDRDEAKRAEQMSELKKASEMTKLNREKIQKEKKQKNSVLKTRLKKIRDRKRAKAGLPPLPDSEEEDEDEEETKEEEKTDETEEQKPPEIRAWDVGKKGVFGPKPSTFDELDEKWLKDRRSDRNPDFAPPSSIYSQGGLKRQYNSKISESSTSFSSFNSSKYSNFVKSSDPPPTRATSESPSPPPPVVIEPQPKPFLPPENFWKKKQQQQNAPPPQKPIPIKDEMPAPIPLSSEEFDRNRGGVEVAPPPTFEYYHGGEPKAPRRLKTQSDESVNDAVSTGLKALREQFESRKQNKPSTSKIFPEFN
ncbi:hypothetical protein Ocin01_08158 [Orchesella cincta]|uniref:CCDC174 alpha/beta GRSR domain-containing protein n=1 Tax=Orchesella cincta TaxID=48709 RepID=A0A1D2MZR9_ORCCI|nr:hypothetical protein Ocin01_08158 [Orchesella cincta]